MMARNIFAVLVFLTGCTAQVTSDRQVTDEGKIIRDEGIFVNGQIDLEAYDTASYFIAPVGSKTEPSIRPQILSFANSIGDRNAATIVENDTGRILEIQKETGCNFTFSDGYYSYLFLITATKECTSGSFKHYSSARRTFTLINTMIENEDLCNAKRVETEILNLAETAGEEDQYMIVRLGSRLVKLAIGGGIVDC